MFARQCITGFLTMVVPGIRPGRRLVAAFTLGTQPAFVLIITGVTIETKQRRVTMLPGRHVAFFAGSFQMCAIQMEICQPMIKIIRLQSNHVCSPAFMFRVTGSTFIGSRPLRAAMKTTLVPHVFTNIFVASKTESSLLTAGERCMALSTICLDIRMKFNDRAGHDERFKINRCGTE
jgi:hypothetical protein